MCLFHLLLRRKCFSDPNENLASSAHSGKPFGNTCYLVWEHQPSATLHQFVWNLKNLTLVDHPYRCGDRSSSTTSGMVSFSLILAAPLFQSFHRKRIRRICLFWRRFLPFFKAGVGGLLSVRLRLYLLWWTHIQQHYIVASKSWVNPSASPSTPRKGYHGPWNLLVHLIAEVPHRL